MDRMTAPHSSMPEAAPLPLSVQDFWHAEPASRSSDAPGLWRVAVFLPAILATVALVVAIGVWLAGGGFTGLEYALLALIGASFSAVALSGSMAVAGLLSLLRGRRAGTKEATEPLDVALLVPIYNERPDAVFGNAAAMMDALPHWGGAHRYTLYLLSDTQDDTVAEAEWLAYRALAEQRCDVHYRRRAQNTDRKVGNLAQWLGTWGGRHEAMLVLDADSLMSGRAIRHLADALSADPKAGLIQSVPRLIGAESLFARSQAFANAAYGPLLARGLAVWMGREGNYWGHNAIIRTGAFATCAGLPKLSGTGALGGTIKSHDFVEAALMRRA
ncbi:MAG: glucans biosynthesis glucosyltransferase MdoH, partial [Pseudomonadota bacterium]